MFVLFGQKVYQVGRNNIIYFDSISFRHFTTHSPNISLPFSLVDSYFPVIDCSTLLSVYLYECPYVYLSVP